jgi:uncharacterized protein YpuA (DUF1002 family)
LILKGVYSKTKHVKTKEEIRKIAERVVNDKHVKAALEDLFLSLPKNKRDSISRTLSQQSEKSHWTKENQEREKNLRTLEIVASSKESAGFLEKLVSAIERAWNMLTNEDYMPPQEEEEIISYVIAKGIEKELHKEKEALSI